MEEWLLNRSTDTDQVLHRFFYIFIDQRGVVAAEVI